MPEDAPNDHAFWTYSQPSSSPLETGRPGSIFLFTWRRDAPVPPCFAYLPWRRDAPVPPCCCRGEGAPAPFFPSAPAPFFLAPRLHLQISPKRHHPGAGSESTALTRPKIFHQIAQHPRAIAFWIGLHDFPRHAHGFTQGRHLALQLCLQFAIFYKIIRAKIALHLP